jgi:hypothetical protein
MRNAVLTALGIRDEADTIRGLPRGELQARTRAGERAQAAAPADVSRTLRLTAQAEADAGDPWPPQRALEPKARPAVNTLRGSNEKPRPIPRPDGKPKPWTRPSSRCKDAVRARSRTSAWIQGCRLRLVSQALGTPSWRWLGLNQMNCVGRAIVAADCGKAHGNIVLDCA